MMHSSDERKNFDRNAFRQTFKARMDNNVENNEWNRRRRWMMSTASSLGDSRQQPMIMSSRPPLMYNNSTTSPSPDAVNQHSAINNERSSRNMISSIEISSQAKRKLWLLGQRYSSSSSTSSIGDAQSSVAGSSSSGTRSIPGPVSPPSLRNKRIGNLQNYDPVQMLLLHANRYDNNEVNEVGSVGRDTLPSTHEDQNMSVQGGHLDNYNAIQMLLLHAANRNDNNEVESIRSDSVSSSNEDQNMSVQGDHLLQLLNQLARSNDNAQQQPTPPRHLDVTTLGSTDDDDDGTSMLSNVSSLIFPTQVSRADGETSEIGVIEEDGEDSQNDESDDFSSFYDVQSVLLELDQDENILQSSPSVEKNPENDDDDEDWGSLLSFIALSILAVVSILLSLSGLFSLQAKIDNWKESMAIRFWEAIKMYERMGFEEFSMASALLHNWAESMTRQLSGIMERCETLYSNTLNDLLHQRHIISASFSLSNVTSFSMQQLERTTAYFSDMDVTSMTLEQFYRLAKVYYSSIELFKTAQSSFIDVQASIGLTWNATLLAVTASGSKNWLVTPLSYRSQDQFSISKSTVTMPIVFNVGIDHYNNETIRYQEEDEIHLDAQEATSLHKTSSPFWRPQPRAFIQHTFPVPEPALRTRPSINLIESVDHSLVASQNLTALVVQRVKPNSKQHSKPKKKQKKIRDYYDSVIQTKQSEEKDVFDGVDVMSIASDAIVGWWQQHRKRKGVK